MPECMTPLSIKNTGGTLLPYSVPCGKCPNCYKRRVSEWSFRLMQHEKQCISSNFITLTYDTEHIPINGQGFRTLEKKDLQNFFKRLRKLGEHKGSPKPPKISYYAVGEYGGRTHRPHYHIILFNGCIDTIQRAWRLDNKDIGSVHYGVVSGASIGYCLKYMSKRCKIGVPEWDTRQRQFALFSKGLGANYLTDAMKKWHYDDDMNRMYVNLLDGRKVSMPRYYKDKLYGTNQRKIIGEYQRAQKELRQISQPCTQTEAEKASAVAAAFIRMERNDLKGRTI
ncbi:MAG: replication initiator protein [Microvirus sp.]|nr:MAG: replication initiator protein [Microvirus sp.]